MPPKKRRCQRSQKTQLLFHQQPLEDPKHHCEASHRPVTHTVQVPSKPIDQGTITSWIVPEFDTTENQFPANRKHHRKQARHSGRKSSSKFPCLPFESPQSSNSETLGLSSIGEGSNPSEKETPRRPFIPMLSPPSCGDLSTHTLQSLPHVFILPDIQTPESSSVKADPVPPDLRENSLSSCLLLSGTPKSPEPGPVLVKDTPEEKYGIKVTWRRRKHLFTYLKERGKLSRSQFLVKS